MKSSQAFLKKKSIHINAQLGHYLISDLLDDYHKDQLKRNRLKLNQRKDAFKDKLIPKVEKFGKAIVRDFYDYWTEHGENDKKMRFEKETSFDITKRLQRFARNDSRYNPKNGQVPETVKMNTENHVK